MFNGRKIIAQSTSQINVRSHCFSSIHNIMQLNQDSTTLLSGATSVQVQKWWIAGLQWLSSKLSVNNCN